MQLIEIIKRERYVYLVMEYCEEGDLSTLLKREGGQLAENLVQKLMLQLSTALKTLQEAKLVHRDLKPQNLLLQRTAVQELLLKVADFGFARFMQPSDLAETLCGSPLYMVFPATLFICNVGSRDSEVREVR